MCGGHLHCSPDAVHVFHCDFTAIMCTADMGNDTHTCTSGFENMHVPCMLHDVSFVCHMMCCVDVTCSEKIVCMMPMLWLQHTRSMMGPYIDIPGPEISAGSRMMSWLFDEYSKYKRFSPACVTGKVRHSGSRTYHVVSTCIQTVDRYGACHHTAQLFTAVSGSSTIEGCQASVCICQPLEARLSLP